MKRLAVVSTCLLLAACGGGPRYHNYGPPPPSETETATLKPYAPPAPPTPYKPPPPPKVTSAGPLNAAGVGSYMDRQEADLRHTMRGTGVLVARPGDDIVLHIRSDEIFKPDSLELNDRGLRILSELAPVLRRYDHTAISIDAYTDTSGAADKNMEVSRKRAYTVGGALVKDEVPLSRLRAQGHGETDLKVKTGDDVNDARNRRIEISIVPRPEG